ncbi:MAG: methyl-accepting chemotaxis protein [Negativicutes bacterium]|nr:methyl-accepting chemotaxis protein [Negativicutes bacterium]
MQWFKNFRLMTQIMGMVLLAVFFLALVGFTGFYFNRQANSSLEKMYSDSLRSVDLLQETRVNIRANEALQLAVIVAPDKATRDDALKEMSERTKKNDDNISAYEKNDLDQFEKDGLVAYKKQMAALRANRQQLIDFALAGKTQEAIDLYNIKIGKQMDDIQTALRVLADYNVKQAEEANKQNERNAVISNSIISGVSLLALILCSSFGYWVARSIARPVGSVTDALAEVANGNLTVRDLDIETTNEVGRLASALNAMKNNMTGLVRQIQNNSHQVAASAEELTASAEQSAQAANQVAGSITEVATGADKQVAAVNETSSIVEQMSAGIQQIAASSQTVAGVTDKTAGAATEGSKAVETAVGQMKTIEHTVNSSAQVVTKLGERSKEIGQIVDTISGIAGQTNLLALNAAIEAARAGEQGRGFAVVAEEVRKLAEQSQEAAKQIASLIGEIQSETDKAVVAMNQGTQEVKVGTEVVNTAGRAFGEITGLIGQVSSQIREIAAAIQQMASGSQQVVNSVRQIDRIGKEAAGHTQTVSAATEEQSASMEEIASSSQALARMAEELQNAVSKFTVSK